MQTLVGFMGFQDEKIAQAGFRDGKPEIQC
jgi:hypothetical protein